MVGRVETDKSGGSACRLDYDTLLRPASGSGTETSTCAATWAPRRLLECIQCADGTPQCSPRNAALDNDRELLEEALRQCDPAESSLNFAGRLEALSHFAVDISDVLVLSTSVTLTSVTLYTRWILELVASRR